MRPALSMTPLKRCLIATCVALAFVSCFSPVAGKVPLNVSASSTANDTSRKSDDAPGEASTRSGRVMHIFRNNHVRTMAEKRPVYGQPMMHPRVDRFPRPNGIQQQRLPIVYQRRPVASALHPQIVRRVQSNPSRGHPFRTANQIPSRYEVAKNSQFSNVKDGPYHGASFKGDAYRVSAAAAGVPHHSNSLLQVHNFKASPNFNGKVKVRPLATAIQPQQLPHKQHALNQREQFTAAALQQQQQQQQPSLSYFHYQQPKQQEPLLQPKPISQEAKLLAYPPERASAAAIHKTPFASTGYAVYEDPETPFQTSENYISDEEALNEAQEYLRFMSTNTYFLPKRDPNYRGIDGERDYLQHQQRQQSPRKPGQQQRQQYQLQQREQQQSYGKSAYDSILSGSRYPQHKQQEPPNQNHHQPIEVGQLFYGEESLTSSPSPQLSSRTMAHESYQNAENEFVVNSDGKKGVKNIVSALQTQLSSISTPVPSAYAYQHFHLNSVRNRTPEPVRFEFTERDAMSPATYTHSPPTYAQLRRHSQEIPANHLAPSTTKGPTKSRGGAESTRKPPSHTVDAVKPAREDFNDDLEDTEDMMETGGNAYGRIPIHTSMMATSQQPPIEQKDTEDYCERICSNVQDDDDDIVCGSDGYMYTSEAQMECYASCLHIDVTIQTKGTCSAR